MIFKTCIGINFMSHMYLFLENFQKVPKIEITETEEGVYAIKFGLFKHNLYVDKGLEIPFQIFPQRNRKKGEIEMNVHINTNLYNYDVVFWEPPCAHMLNIGMQWRLGDGGISNDEADLFEARYCDLHFNDGQIREYLKIISETYGKDSLRLENFKKNMHLRLMCTDII